MRTATDKLTHNRDLSTAEEQRSRAISASTPPVPDQETAAILSSIIDRARAAMGWNALPQTTIRGEQSPQDLAIVSWFEICHDAGMLAEQYTPCYRAAQQRKRELLAQGKELTIVTPHDLCAELDKVRKMNAEIDNTRLLAESAASLCLRCFGKKPAVDTCDHRPLSKEELDEQARARVEEVRKLRADLASKAAVKSMPTIEHKMDLSVTYTCTECGRRVNSTFGWNYHDRCNERLPGPVRDGETHGCSGVMEVL